jgi:type IV fimbrial biogenesis protein FimT
MQRSAFSALTVAENGLTLIELISTLALGAMLLGIGIPSFLQLAGSNQQTAEINSFVRHLNLARSSAVKTGRDHVLCPSNDLSHCADQVGWQAGFILFEDRNENGTRERDETLEHVNRPTGKFAIDMHASSGRTYITFRADGRSYGSNLTLTFCDPEGDVPPKAVILSNSGRARISRTRVDGSPLVCDS